MRNLLRKKEEAPEKEFCRDRFLLKKENASGSVSGNRS